MNTVGYFSSYDRGLECLLDMWPKILEQVPEAKLNIYYGWDIFDKVHRQNQEKMRWKWSIIRKLNELKDSVTEHGRVDHKTLKEAMEQTKIWAYPTEFNEIHCITALKAQVAGCIPVTTGCYALAETVINNKYTVRCEDIYTNRAKQKEFVDNVVKALNLYDKDIVASTDWFWSDVAMKWDKELQ